jgi:hypothetical protein
MSAELNGKPVSSQCEQSCSMEGILNQLERWFSSEHEPLLHISRLMAGHCWEVATPRSRIAVFFVMTALERELMRPPTG